MRARRENLATIALAPTLLVLAAGCGGQSTDESAPEAAPLGEEVRLDTDDPGEADSTVPQLILDGDRLMSVWLDDRNGEDELYFNRSDDGGATWLDEDVRIPGTGQANLDDVPTQFCADGDRLYVTWAADPFDDGTDSVWFTASYDGGSTWFDDPQVVDPDVAADSDDPAIACSETTVLVVWKDDRFGADEIFYNRTTDAGQTWDGEKHVKTTAPPGSSNSRAPWIDIEGNTVAVCWVNDRDGAYDVRLCGSKNGGATWEAFDVLVEADEPGAAASEEPRLVVQGSEILVAWQDYRSDGATADIYLQRSTDYGVTWLKQDVRLDSADPDVHTDEIAKGRGRAGAVVVWESDFPNCVYANASSDGGATWLDEEVLVDDTPIFFDADEPTVCLSGPRVAVAYEDDRNGRDEIRLSLSYDGGATFEPSVRLDQDTPGLTPACHPRIGCSEEGVFAVWEDHREGGGDIFGVRFLFD